MKNDDSMLSRLISSFKVLPGIGEKTAQRMAFYLLEKNRLGGKELSRNLLESMSHIKNCQDCRNFTEDTFCSICSNEKRNSDMLCTVEGDATAFYIGEQFKNHSIKVSRIAYGVPMGGELEYVDNTTLGRSIKGRRELE